MLRKFTYRKILLMFMLVHPVLTAPAQIAIHWEKFMQRNDMVFDTLTTKWEEGAFMGNGLLGAMIYMKDSSTLRLDIGRTDVTDHRSGNINELFGQCRLPIGYFLLKPLGRIIRNSARVDLWNAEIRGNITTTKGIIVWRALSFSESNVISFETQCSGDEQNFTWQWVPEVSVSPRLLFPKMVAPAGYAANPQGSLLKTTDKPVINYYHQPMLAGGGYTTAWLSSGKAAKRSYLISVGYAQQGSLSNKEALKNIRYAFGQNKTDRLYAHRNWWHRYYKQSFISMPDRILQSFYWIQLYKLASASRKGKPLIDLMGPWMNATPWPAYWWNLNIELTYSPLYTSNHLDIASGLPAAIDRNKENLINNTPIQFRHNALALGRAGGAGMNAVISVTCDSTDKAKSPGELELGNATWMLYYYWQQYRYSMNKSILIRLFPLLKRSINYYLDILQSQPDGYYHLPYTASPEYPGGITRDCNYDLSLLRWGCQTLLKADILLGTTDTLQQKWRDVLQRITPYPTDRNGLMIGRDVPFSTSHRHFSHMLMIYPLHLMNWDQPENRELIEKSLTHWHSMPAAMQGYSFTGGASIYATMGEGNKARDYLHTLISQFVKPNTMYLESGPVIETPLAATASIQEMFLQSWGDVIKVFPAVPNDWANASFKDLRSEGAFLISAVRKNRQTQWVRIKATANGLCAIKPGLKGLVKIQSTRPMQITDSGDEVYLLRLIKGDEITLYANATALKTTLNEVNTDRNAANPFGKKIKQLNN